MIWKISILLSITLLVYFVIEQARYVLFDRTQPVLVTSSGDMVESNLTTVSESLTFNIGTGKFLVSNWSQTRFWNVQSSHGEAFRGEAAEGVYHDDGAITVLNAQGIGSLTSDWLQEVIDQMTQVDDVFEAAFLSRILFDVGSGGSQPSIKADVMSYLETRGNKMFGFIRTETAVPHGPYWISSSNIHHLYKLVPDPYGAFMFGAVPRSRNSNEGFRQVHSDLIPIPSRLYSGQPTAAQPLRGKRVGVKDIYDVQGLVTSVSCRAYADLYGSAKVTAPSVQKLIDSGAVLVGKTKTAQFASGEGPQHWVDYQCSFNPRGDGYFTPSGSSTGSAVGVAAYDWLDYAIGTDSLGSMISPSSDQALFGIRPTHGLIDRSNILKLSALLDSPGFFARNIEQFKTFGSAWYWSDSTKSKNAMVVRKLLYLDSWFDDFSPAQRDVLDNFVTDVEQTYGISRTVYDVNEAWQAAGVVPSEESVQDYQNETIANIQLFDCYNNNRKFRDEYFNTHGHQPYVNPMIRYKWDLGSKLSKSSYDESVRRKEIFRRFLQDNVFAQKNTIMVLPSGEGAQIRYRDDYTGTWEEAGSKMQGYGFRNIVFGVIGGSPLVSVPVGQVEATSKVTGAQIYQPLSLLFVGPEGSDGQLVEVIEKVLKRSNRPLEVMTGPQAF